jgi:hypothetical protein
MPSRNGNIKKALELGRQLSPQDATTLRLGRDEVLLGLAESDQERSLLAECLAGGWEERPAESRLYNRVALRVVHAEDRAVLTRAEGFRVFLPEAMPEPPVNPQLEQLILDQAAKRAAAEAGVEALQRQLTSGLVELRKLQAKDPKAEHGLLQIQVARLRDDVSQARDAADRESGRLAQLLAIRASRRRAFALAESIKK